MLTKIWTGVIFLIDSISTRFEWVLTKAKDGERVNEMELDDRKSKILRSIIKNYLETGEPVGSRTISKILDLQLSSATIRNEMADLEMLGYLEHLHTSSGRVPSSKGYRFYVDGLIPPKPVSDEEKALIDRWYKGWV